MNNSTNKNQYITIIQEIYNIDRVNGIEYLTYNVRVATDMDDECPKYEYKVNDKNKAVGLAEKIHNDQRTADLIYIYA